MVEFDKKVSEGKPSEEGVEKDVDMLLADQPEELRRIRENRVFLRKAEEEPIAEADAEVTAFTKKDGTVVSVNLNAILKKNIQGRNCFVVDHLCKMFLQMTIADLIKFQKKKKPLSFNYMWLLIIIFGALAVLIFLLVILPMMQGGGSPLPI